MNINHILSLNPVLGFMCWVACKFLSLFLYLLEEYTTLLHEVGKYQKWEFPIWFMQAGQLIFWCIGGCVGLITIFEFLKKHVPYFQKRFKN